MVEPPVAPKPTNDKPNEADPMQVSDNVAVNDGAMTLGTVLTV
jgi:hypothetical protein